MSDFYAWGHEVNSLARSNRYTDALAAAHKTLELIFGESFIGRMCAVSFRPTAELRIASRSHLRLDLLPDVLEIKCSLDLVDESFTNRIDAFVALRTLMDRTAFEHLHSGSCVFDIEDGSNVGVYPRAAFGSALPNASLMTDSYWIKYRGYRDLRLQIATRPSAWKERRATFFWRGGTTGLRSFTPKPGAVSDWRWLQRLHLCATAAKSLHSDAVDIGVSHFAQIDEPYLAEAIRRAGFARDRCEKLHFMEYRYILDIDGNANAWDGLFGALLMGACVMKVGSRAGWRQWYYDRLLPYQHFVPIAADLSDFDDAVGWALSHERECEDIAGQAHALAWGMDYDREVEASATSLLELFKAGVAI